MNISKNKNFKEEYCATVVRIGEIQPIEGRDRIVKTLVNGMSIVIGKDEFKTGDVAVYCANETALNKDFLRVNSMFEDKELNIDKEKRGYINKHGRIRVVKLGGVPSYGLLLHPKNIATFIGETWNDVLFFLFNHAGEDFDEINGERFCQVYMPPRKPNNHVSTGDKRGKKLKRFKMLIDGSFRFHYDTKQLAKEIRSFSPDDEVDISVKLHGTSAIFANILTNQPTNWLKRMWRKYILHTEPYDQAYSIVYSSRSVIKNEYINPKQRAGGYYSDDVWGYWAKKLEGLIPKDTCIYGEIVGYMPNGTAIQKGYDYGCLPDDKNQSILMIYRVTVKGDDLEIADVMKFGNVLHELFSDTVIKYPLLYHGKLRDLYPDLDTSNHWHENFLERLKNDETFYMEKNEPLCNNAVPREGIVLRKCNDPVAEAFKLKTDAFRLREAKAVDAGEVDMEMAEAY